MNLFLMTCCRASFLCGLLLLTLSDCANSLPQQTPTGQTSSYQPLYGQTPPHDQPGYWQNVSPNLRTAPDTAVIQGQPTPPVVAPVAAPVRAMMAPPAPPPPQASATVKAAILLPLTGSNAALGQAMLNAAQQAVFDAAGTSFQLQPRDTAGPGGAAAAAQQAVEAGAQIIIGPLFATDIPAVETVAQKAGLPMLPLSTDTALAAPGVYVMGLAPQGQVARVVAYALEHGARRFAALVPATPYGAVVGESFRQAVTHGGGSVIDDETCDFTAGAAACVKNLAQLRGQIDALFLPESGDMLRSVSAQLTAAGFAAGQVRILGTGLWDVPGIGRQTPLINGGWYAAPDPAARRAFAGAYAGAYGQQPPRLATLAYDATALAAVLAKRGGGFNELALTNPNGFAGLDGIFRLLPGGAVERGLAVDQITPDSAAVIDPAPASFVGQGR